MIIILLRTLIFELQTLVHVLCDYCLTSVQHFDTIDHSVLIDGLKQWAGITGTALDWFP